MSSSNSSQWQTIFQQYLNQDRNIQPTNPLNSSINSNRSFSMNNVIQLMNQYHTIIQEYQNLFRLVILMESLHQTAHLNQLEQQTLPQQPQHLPRTTQTRMPRVNPRTSTIPVSQPPTTSSTLSENIRYYANRNAELSSSSSSPPIYSSSSPPSSSSYPSNLSLPRTTEPSPEENTDSSQNISFVDLVVEIDDQFTEIFGNTNISNQSTQNLINNLFQNDQFRNTIIQNTGITPSTNMQWFTSIVNSQAIEETGLTNEQIERYTRRITYENEMPGLLSHTCPITMEDFREGDVLLQLTECSHTFREMDLLRWFVTHSTCPVCRHSYQENQNFQRHK